MMAKKCSEIACGRYSADSAGKAVEIRALKRCIEKLEEEVKALREVFNLVNSPNWSRYQGGVIFTGNLGKLAEAIEKVEEL